jgi:hypothetical protein
VSYRRRASKHDLWTSVVEASDDLLAEVPAGALSSEAAFRDYLTRGVHRGVAYRPTVFELDAAALDKLWCFINERAQLDMDATLFDDFNEAFRARDRRG